MNVERAAANPLGARLEVLSSLALGLPDRIGLASLIGQAGELISRGSGFDQLTVTVLDEGANTAGGTVAGTGDGTGDSTGDGTGDGSARCTVQSFDADGRPLGPPEEVPADDLPAATSVATGGQLFYEPDTTASRFSDLARLARLGLCNAVVVPMWSNDRPVGSLMAARRAVGFEGLDLMALDLAAAIVASAVESQRADEVAQRAEIERYKKAMVLRRRTDEIGALARMVEAVERLDLSHAAVAVADEMVSLRGIEVCRITVLEPDGSLVPVASTSCFIHRSTRRQVERVPAEAPDAIAVATDDLVLWRRPDPDHKVVVEGLGQLGLTSVFALPIRLDGVVAGAILAGSTGGHRLVVDEHLVVADIAGQLLAGAARGPGDLHRLVARLRIPAPVRRGRER